MRAGALGRMPILSPRWIELRRCCLLRWAKSPAVIAIQMAGTMHALAAILAIVRLKQVALPLSSEMPIAEQVEQQRIAGATFLLSAEGLRPQPSTAKCFEINQSAFGAWACGLNSF